MLLRSYRKTQTFLSNHFWLRVPRNQTMDPKQFSISLPYRLRWDWLVLRNYHGFYVLKWFKIAVLSLFILLASILSSFPVRSYRSTSTVAHLNSRVIKFERIIITWKPIGTPNSNIFKIVSFFISSYGLAFFQFRAFSIISFNEFASRMNR